MTMMVTMKMMIAMTVIVMIIVETHLLKRDTGSYIIDTRLISEELSLFGLAECSFISDVCWFEIVVLLFVCR